MLIAHRDIYCGLFDSAIARGNIPGSDLRTVECFELELFHSATGTSYVNGEKHPTARGMLLCAKPGQIRRSEFPVKCSFIRIFKNKYVSNSLYEILSALPNCTYIDNDSKTEDLLAKFAYLGALFTSTNILSSDEALINSIFFDILHHILTIAKGIENTHPRNDIKKVALDAYEYINENLSSDCSLNAVAQAVNISPSYLQVIFTKSFGISPYKYAVIKRIEKAKKMITVGDKTMLQISLELGFCSQSHFNRIFKAQTGITPAEYRSERLLHDPKRHS